MDEPTKKPRRTRAEMRLVEDAILFRNVGPDDYTAAAKLCDVRATMATGVTERALMELAAAVCRRWPDTSGAWLAARAVVENAGGAA